MPFTPKETLVKEYAPKIGITEDQLDKLLEEFNTYALERYDEGFDVVVECWGTRELLEYMLEEKASTLEDTIKFASKHVGYYEEKKLEVTSHIF